MSTSVERENDEQSGSGTKTVDCKGVQEVYQKLTLTGAMTVAVTNFDGTSKLFLEVVQDGVGGHALSFSVDFLKASAPSVGASMTDIWTFVKAPDDTTFCEAAHTPNVT